jgi:hypothetical protein
VAHHAHLKSIARRGGLATAASHDMRKVAANARRSGPNEISYFFPLVDPDGTLDPLDRDRRALAAQKLWFSNLGRKSAAARKKRATSNGLNATKARPRNRTSVPEHRGSRRDDSVAP